MKLDWKTAIENLSKRKQLDKDTYELTPEEANIMLNAFTPYDLITKPSNLPRNGGPAQPDVAFNAQNEGEVGVKTQALSIQMKAYLKKIKGE